MPSLFFVKDGEKTMANADISLLFGVLGEGSLGGESGSLIQSQLTQIMTALNKNPLKVKVALDTDAGGQKSWSSQLQSKLNTVSSSGKFSVQVSKLTLGSGAITDFRNQLNAVVNTLHLDKGTTITLTAEGIGEIKSKMKQAGDAAADAAKKTAEFKVQMEALNRQKVSVQRALTTLSNSATTEEEKAQVAALIANYEQWAVKIEQIRATKTAASSGYRAEIEAEGAAIANNIEMLRQEQAAASAAAAAGVSAATEQAAAEQAAASASESGAKANKDAAAEQKDLNAARKQGLSLLTQMQKAERDWTAAKTGKTSSEYNDIQASIRSLQVYLEQLRSGEIDVTTFKQHLAELGGTFASSSNAIKLAGENTRTFGERMGGLAKKFGAWLSVTRVIMTVIQTIRKMVANTRDIDTSLTQLRIVTGATDAEMETFLVKSTQLAKELGQSITNVLGSIETFSRLGYNLGDASQLAEFANVLANVAAVGTDEATTGLTSIIKGFNMDVSEAEHVADVLVEVGQKYAVSAGEMIEAYEKSGAALNAANTSFEKSAGLIAAANASVQNASTVGTALKTISARIRGATADLEALGEDTSDLAQGFSKYAEEIKALTGFDIMVDGSTDTYKDIYDIFEGISKVWDDLSDTQQARISEILGGTRQLQVISSILGNWGDAAGAYADAMASAGTATEANTIYMDSINGRIGVLNATFQEFSNNLLNSGLIKFFVDLGTNIISALNALEKLHLLLPMVASVVVTIKALRAGMTAMHGAVASAETASAINTIVARLVAEKGATDALAVSVANLTIAEKAELATKIQAAVASGSLTAAESEQILATLGLVTAEGTLTVANHTLGASFKALMASIPVWGWIALGVSALITAVTALSGAFKSNEEKLAELNEEYDELYSTIRNVSSEFKSLKTSADEVIPRFAELAKGVNKFGDNVSLTDEEYAEFLELNNRVAEMFPELNLGMDENGNYMLALSYGADTLTDSLYGLLEAQRLLAAQELADTLPDLVDNVKEQEKVYNKEKKALQNRLDYYQQAYDAYSEMFSDEVIGNYKDAYGEEWETYFNSALDSMSVSYVSYMQEAFDAFNNTDSWQRMLDKFTNADTGLIDWWAVLNSDEFENVLAGIERELDNVGDKVQAKWNTINPAVNAWLQTDFIYNDMNEQMQTIARTMVSGLDFSELGLTTAESIENYITDYIINPLYNSGADVREAFANITNWQDELRNGEITFDEFSERVESAFDDLLSSMSDEDAATFADNFVAGFNAMGIAGNDFDDVVDNIIDNWGAVTGAVSGTEAATAVGDLAEEVTELKKAYDLLKTAQEEVASGEGLSPDTIAELAAAEENYLDYLYEENGIIKLNTEAWKENANAKMKDDIASIQSEIAALEEKNAVLREQISTIENQETVTRDNAAWWEKARDAVGGFLEDTWIEMATSELEENTRAIEENQAKLALYSSLYGSITGDLDSYSAALANFSNISTTVDGISNSFQTLADLQAQVANGFTMSLDKALEFAAVYPEILNNAQVSANGQIVLNEGVVNTFLQGKKAELDAQIDSEIAKLEADKAVLQAKMETAQAQLDLAKNVGEGEGQVSKEVAEYRIRASNEMVKALIDNGIDEAEAFKLAAAAMSLNAEEFDRVAKEVCVDVDGNFNNAAYNAAMGIYENMERAKTDINSVTKQAHEAAKAIKGIGTGAILGADTKMKGSGGGRNRKGIDTNVTSGEFNGFDFDFSFKGASLDDFISQVELDISSYKDAIAQIDGQIAVLQALKNTPLKKFRSNTGSGSSKDATKEVEEYIAAIDDYREAIERLNRIRIKKAELELDLSNTDDLREQIRLQESLVNIYRDEQDAMHNLNDLRDKTISDGAETLRQLGFNVEYNPDSNKFFIQNLEHLNELVADSKGEYDSLQEATNALREDTEEFIKTLESLNEENQENSETWWELRNSIREAKIAIIDALKQIVSDASDAVDEIQNVYDTLKDAADEYAENGGFISVDAFQKIIELGPQYMQYLRDENGLLVINEENINKVIAARTRQLAAEQAVTYVERLRLALQEDSIENLNTLLYATTEATDATFGLAYAELALMHSLGDLDDEQYAAALHNIQSIEDLANTAIAGIGKVAGSSKEELEKMKSGVDDILKYVMDMLKHRIQQQIDALEELKDAYGDIIDLRKEALEAAKEEAEYEDKVAEKVKQIAKLQERINALSLDDSRDAQAQKIKLEEEMAELQKELADDQSDYAVDAQKDALDEMKDAYEEEKDAEIAALEETISSYQKLYDMAIAYIQSHWDTLYSELIAWNTEYGSVLNSEITEAWNNCLAAAQRYGSYVAALNSIDNDIAASTNGTSNNTIVGNTGDRTQSSKEESIHSIIKEMYRNSQEWHTANEGRRKDLDKRNLQLGSMLAQYGVNAHREGDGAWYMNGSKQLLFDKYKQYIYHKGGIAGDNPTLKQNEVMAILEKGEAVLDKRREQGLYRLVEFATTMADKFSNMMKSSDLSHIFAGAGNGLSDAKADIPSNVLNSNALKIEIGPTYIYGANDETVAKHQAVTRQQANELFAKLNIKR